MVRTVCAGYARSRAERSDAQLTRPTGGRRRRSRAAGRDPLGGGGGAVAGHRREPAPPVAAARRALVASADVARPAVRALGGATGGAPACGAGADPDRHLRRQRLDRHHAVRGVGTAVALQPATAAALAVPGDQRPDLHHARRPAGDLVPQPRRGERPGRGRRRAQLPAPVLPGTHVGRARAGPDPASDPAVGAAGIPGARVRRRRRRLPCRGGDRRALPHRALLPLRARRAAAGAARRHPPSPVAASARRGGNPGELDDRALRHRAARGAAAAALLATPGRRHLAATGPRVAIRAVSAASWSSARVTMRSVAAAWRSYPAPTAHAVSATRGPA